MDNKTMIKYIEEYCSKNRRLIKDDLLDESYLDYIDILEIIADKLQVQEDLNEICQLLNEK